MVRRDGREQVGVSVCEVNRRGGFDGDEEN